jgi:fibronectin-binding autotransporter adhesin
MANTISSTSGGAIDVQAGLLTLSGDNKYTGETKTEGGTLSVAAISDIRGVASNIGWVGGSGNCLTVKNGGVFQYTGTEDAETTRYLWMDNGSNGTIDVANAGTTLTFSPTGGERSVNFTKAGAGSLVMNGSIQDAWRSGVQYSGGVTVNAGLLTLTAANIYSGETKVQGGTLSVSAIADGSGISNIGLTGGSTNCLTVKSGGTFRYTGTTDAATTRDLWVDLGAGGTFDIANSGVTLTLSPAGGSCTTNFTKTGAGNLVMNGAITGAASVAVNEGALKLGGANTYSGNTTVLAGASFTLAEGASMVLDVNNDSSSQILGNGSVSLNGNLYFNMADVTKEQDWTVVASAANYGSLFKVWMAGGAAFDVDSTGKIWTYNGESQGTAFQATFSETSGVLSVMAVPEPGTLGILFGGMIGLVAYAWRKRTS